MARASNEDGGPLVLQQIWDRAVAAGVLPGGVLLVGRHEEGHFQRAFGARQVEPHWSPTTTSTVYDVASVTKAVCTSVVAMKAVASNLVNLAEPVQGYLPEFQGRSKERVTIRHLLCHASGLPAHRPFHELVLSQRTTASTIKNAAAVEPLIAEPGEHSVYSDLGFILLGWLLERAMGKEIDALFREHVAAPLGLSTARFIRSDGVAQLQRSALRAQFEVAPTQVCPIRGGLVCGEVDDLNAAAMAGVAGHAGLFSDAADLSAIADALVGAWQGDGTDTLVPREIVREFWRSAGVPASTWRLGWDGPAAEGSQAGAKISRNAVGHLGFTGCSIWIDPAPAHWVILLTNRVHPTAHRDPRFARFRADIHDAAVDLLQSPTALLRP